MPVSILLLLIVGISIVMFFYLRPLKFYTRQEWLISHGFIIGGLVLVLGWIWINREPYQEITMLMGGIWTLAGALCFVVGYIVKKKKR
ncbi:MAG: hypothetical protein OEY11_14065 [Gammaproteobacteria bacterium]|nr:hypothetical protein [Gammaproteobacteria bacterium]